MTTWKEIDPLGLNRSKMMRTSSASSRSSHLPGRHSLRRKPSIPRQAFPMRSYVARAISATGDATAPDGRAHYLAAARVYALFFNADVNLTYFFSNLYLDDFEDKSRLGLSVSRYFLTDYELHVEAL